MKRFITVMFLGLAVGCGGTVETPIDPPKVDPPSSGFVEDTNPTAPSDGAAVNEPVLQSEGSTLTGNPLNTWRESTRLDGTVVSKVKAFYAERFISETSEVVEAECLVTKRGDLLVFESNQSTHLQDDVPLYCSVEFSDGYKSNVGGSFAINGKIYFKDDQNLHMIILKGKDYASFRFITQSGEIHTFKVTSEGLK